MNEMDSVAERVLSLLDDADAETSDDGEGKPGDSDSSDACERGAYAEAKALQVAAEGILPDMMREERRRTIDYGPVGELAQILARALGQPLDWQEKIREAAPMHNIGKVWVPDEILNKSGPLSDEEFEKVKEHTVMGALLLSKRGSDRMQMATRIARSHHERWDGEGYPDGLEGEEIPLEARIVSVADTINAMTQDRPYRDALPIERAFEVIEEEAGSEFDPAVSKAALENRNELAALV